MSANPSTSAPIGTRTFKKSYVRQYGILFVLVPFAFLLVWLALSSPEARTASLVSVVVCILFCIIPFVQVSSITVESNKLKIETFLEEKVVSASQIKEIKMKSVRGRYGRVTNFVNIVLAEGKNYPVNGFVDGDEFIYGFLTNWWEANRNQ
jgi:hypothetical protein